MPNSPVAILRVQSVEEFAAHIGIAAYVSVVVVVSPTGGETGVFKFPVAREDIAWFRDRLDRRIVARLEDG